MFFNGQTATQNDAKDIGLTVVCSPVPLTCAKPFTEFPNACTGVLPLVSGKAKSLPVVESNTFNLMQELQLLQVLRILHGVRVSKGPLNALTLVNASLSVLQKFLS